MASTIVPCLLYRDAPAMIDWLCTVFGFSKKAVYMDGEKVAHAELTLGAGMLMLGSTRGTESNQPWATLIRQPDEIDFAETQSPSLQVDDPDAVYQLVKKHGGTIVLDIEDKDYGGRGFSCRDPEGHLWAVGSYNPWV
jgi:uncharacterized glyoxalase superfamily protein PhnB